MKRILIVEDDPVILRLHRFQLSRRPFDTTFCSSVQAALDALHLRNFDLLVLDYDLPDGKGCEIARQTDTPVIFVTGQNASSSRQITEDTGARAVFAKPFSPTMLLRRIDEILAEIPNQP